MSLGGNFANSREFRDNESEKDLRFDVPLSGEVIINNDSMDGNSNQNFSKLLDNLELREENIKEMFTIEDSKMYLRDLHKEIQERQN